MDVSYLLNDVVNEGRAPSYVYEGLDLLIAQIRRLELVDSYMS
jgi:hypothetical protein